MISVGPLLGMKFHCLDVVLCWLLVCSLLIVPARCGSGLIGDEADEMISEYQVMGSAEVARRFLASDEPVNLTPAPAVPIQTPGQFDSIKRQVPLIIAWIGIGLYSTAGFLTVVAIIFPPSKKSPTRQSRVVQKVFSTLVVLFCLLRVLWFCFPIAHFEPAPSYALNQMCFAIFFSMFSLIIFFWAEQYHRKFFDTQSVLPRLRNLFLVCNTLLWVVELVLVSFTIWEGQVPTAQNNGGPLYQASIYLIIVLDVVLAVAFGIYGVGILYQKYTHGLASGLRLDLIQTLVVTVIFAACFTFRVIFFSYFPITGKLMDPIVFRVFAYFVPEIIAVALQVSIVYILRARAWNRMPGAPGLLGSNRGTTPFQNEHDEPLDLPSNSVFHSQQDYSGYGSTNYDHHEMVPDQSGEDPQIHTTKFQRLPGDPGGRESLSMAMSQTKDPKKGNSGLDDFYASQDMRASAMPVPVATQHTRLIAPPRPIRGSGYSAVSQLTSTSPPSLNHASTSTSPPAGSAEGPSSPTSQNSNSTPNANTPNANTSNTKAASKFGGLAAAARMGLQSSQPASPYQ